MTSLIFRAASENSQPRKDLPKFKIGSDNLDSVFECGKNGGLLESGFFEKLYEFFIGPERRTARELMYKFGTQVRIFFLTQVLETRLDSKIKAFKIAAELRSLVNNRTLEHFDALINPKLALLMFQPYGDPLHGIGGFDITAEVPAYPDAPPISMSTKRQRPQPNAAVEFPVAPSVGPVPAREPDIPISSHQFYEPFEPLFRNESTLSSQSYGLGNFDQFNDMHGRVLVEQSRLRNDSIIASKSALPIVPAPVFLVEPQPLDMPIPPVESPAPVTDHLGTLASSFRAVDQQFKQLLNGAAAKLGVLADQLGDKISAAVGLVSNDGDRPKPEVPVDIAMVVEPLEDEQFPVGLGVESSAAEPNPFADLVSIEQPVLSVFEPARLDDVVMAPVTSGDAIPAAPPAISVLPAPEKITLVVESVVQHASGFVKGVADYWEEGNRVEGIAKRPRAPSSESSESSTPVLPAGTAERSSPLAGQFTQFKKDASDDLQVLSQGMKELTKGFKEKSVILKGKTVEVGRNVVAAVRTKTQHIPTVRETGKMFTSMLRNLTRTAAPKDKDKNSEVEHDF